MLEAPSFGRRFEGFLVAFHLLQVILLVASSRQLLVGGQNLPLGGSDPTDHGVEGVHQDRRLVAGRDAHLLQLVSLGDPWVDRLVEYYGSLGRSLWALDLTTDLEIPAFAALSAVEDGPREEIIFGFGAHLDARIALNRALTEVNQMIPTVLRAPEERRRQLLPDFEDAIRWWETASLEAHPYLRAAPDLEPRTIDDFPLPDAEDLREDVLACVGRADAAGCETLAHDLTRPDIGFACARVVVPGLRHFWRRLGPGRLYDVPVDLGWLDAPRSEEEMNPVSVFV